MWSGGRARLVSSWIDDDGSDDDDAIVAYAGAAATGLAHASEARGLNGSRTPAGSGFDSSDDAKRALKGGGPGRNEVDASEVSEAGYCGGGLR